jgi:hypothetical protein
VQKSDPFGRLVRGAAADSGGRPRHFRLHLAGRGLDGRTGVAWRLAGGAAVDLRGAPRVMGPRA